MEYVVRKAIRMLYWNRWISLLMVGEMALCMSVLVYSVNLSASLKAEEMRVVGQEMDMALEILEKNNREVRDEPSLTLRDYKELQEITGGKTFLLVEIPQFFVDAETFYEFSLVLADYEILGLEEGCSYWGAETEEALAAGMNPVPGLLVRQMPKQFFEEYLGMSYWENCVVAPIAYMEEMAGEIAPGFIYAVWDSAEFPDADRVSGQVEEYLRKEHGEQYVYRVYLPEAELRNNSEKVKVSIRVLSHGGILILAVFFVGILSIFQLLFERRKRGYGICLACGASHKQILAEIFTEAALMNLAGTAIGVLAGWIATYGLDVGIMIGGIKVQGSFAAAGIALAACAGVTAVVVLVVYVKLARGKLVEQIQ